MYYPEITTVSNSSVVTDAGDIRFHCRVWGPNLIRQLTVLATDCTPFVYSFIVPESGRRYIRCTIKHRK